MEHEDPIAVIERAAKAHPRPASICISRDVWDRLVQIDGINPDHVVSLETRGVPVYRQKGYPPGRVVVYDGPTSYHDQCWAKIAVDALLGHGLRRFQQWGGMGI